MTQKSSWKTNMDENGKLTLVQNMLISDNKFPSTTLPTFFLKESDSSSIFPVPLQPGRA